MDSKEIKVFFPISVICEVTGAPMCPFSYEVGGGHDLKDASHHTTNCTGLQPLARFFRGATVAMTCQGGLELLSI